MKPRLRSTVEAIGRARRRQVKLTYANVTSTIALVVALGGASAYAASYVITSAAQVQPSVLDQFRSPVLHAYNAGPRAIPHSGAGILLTRLELPKGQSGLLIHATVTLAITGTPGSDAYVVCDVYSTKFPGREDTFTTGGPVGTDTTIPLELSFPQGDSWGAANVVCGWDTADSASGDTVTVSNIQEDAILLQ
jgi:hypothetical protein